MRECIPGEYTRAALVALRALKVLRALINTAHWELLPCFRGAPRSGEGYKKLDLIVLINTATVGASLVGAQNKYRAPGTAPLF